MFWLCFVRGPPSGRSSICGRPALGAKLFEHRAGAIRRGSRLPQKSMRAAQRSVMHGLNLWEARPRREAVRAPSWRDSPRVAPPTEERATCATQRHARAQCVGGPPSGRSFSGTELAPFAAGRASHRKARDRHDAAPCTGSICGRPALGAKLFGRRVGAIRRGSRLLQKCVRAAQRSAMHGLNLWEARPRGEALGAEPAPFAAGRGSHRKACDLHDAAPCTGSICWSPALGAKLFGHRAGAIRRGARLPQKSARPAQRSAMYGLNWWRPALGAKLSGAEPAPFAAGRGSHRKARGLHSAVHGLNLWEARPRGEAFRAPSRRHSPRVAAPTGKARHCIKRRRARAQFVGGPPSGRSFSGTEPAPFAAGRRPPPSVVDGHPVDR